MKKCLLIVFSVLVSAVVFSQETSYRLWKNSSNSRPVSEMRIPTTAYLLKSLDLKSFKAMLPTVRKATGDYSVDNSVVIGIPMPDGKMGTFRIQRSNIMDPELEAKYPDIRTFSGQGISDPTATIVLDYNLMGIHAMVLTSHGDYFIDPAFKDNTVDYLVYSKSNLINIHPFQEGSPMDFNEPTTVGGKAPAQQDTVLNVLPVNCTGTKLRSYRMAIACTGEYAVAATGKPAPTKAQTLSCIQTTFARVVGVYEKELAITMVLVAKEDTIIFTNASTDPFTGNNTATTLINESQTQITKYIGSANFDVGHTFSTGGGGLSGLGVICNASQKASSITGSPTPTGDGYDIDFVAHEMGHAFGGNHTFNDNTNGSCQGNYSSTTNNEPGSGTTIMAYAGICTGDDIQPHSDAFFTAISFNEIEKYNTTGTGRTCAVNTTLTNHPPVVALPANYSIPLKTPFRLMGSATDVDGDALTYCWEQINVGGTPGKWNAPAGDAPIFRFFPPVDSAVRIFPKLRAVVKNVDTIGELKATYARTLKFRLTARDNKVGGGGVCYNEDSIFVIATPAAFNLKYPTTSTVTWYTQHKDSVTWNVSSTDVAPISCAKVAIDLSVDGGYTYPYVLVDSAPNTGSCKITVPVVVSNTARVRVRSIGNVFFNISTLNFKIAAHGVPVSLKMFNGYAKESANHLYWTSVTEVGTDYFEIERSSDGKNFEAYGKVNASRYSNSDKDYTFLDEYTANKDWYYRLKMVDVNGEFTYSNIIKLVRKSGRNEIKAYPNPATDKIVVTHDKTQNAVLNIYNVQGQLVHTEKVSANAVATEINIYNLSNGFYSVIIKDDNATYNTKFIKK